MSTPISTALAAGTSGSGSYSSNFDLDETPLSEGGMWRRAANNFTNVKSSGGVAHGTNGITDSYDDSYALLSGFAADQTIEAVIQRSSNLNTNVTHEAELLLRFTDSTSGARGYECLFAFFGGVQVIRWNDKQGDYTVLSSSAGSGSIGRELRTGDVIKASISGNVISLYINGTLMARATDSAYAAGQPGIGFFTRPGGNSAHLALTQITATSDGAASPAPSAPVVTFSASPTSVASGGTTALNWSSTNATSCTASGAWSGTRPTAGSENSAALFTSPSSFTLTCSGAGGQASRSVNVTVASAPPSAPTVTLSASPTSVASGGTTALTWSSTNATSCTASGEWSGTRPTAGSESSTPLTNSTNSFTLTCTGAGGQASRTVNVTVAASAPSGGSYSSNFDLEESPLSESGTWRRTVNNFTSVKSSGGVAYGTNGVTNEYDDSYALLSAFAPNQTIEATIQRSSSLNTKVTHNAELLLRATDSTSGIRAYECLFAFYGGVQVIRWNGKRGDFTVLPATAGPGGLGRELRTGDVIKASISGNVINLYINGTLMARVTDSTFPTGQPGIGFFTRPGGNSAHLALTRVSASSQ